MNKSKSEQLAFLANDVSVLEIMFANQTGNVVTCPGEYMPDGKNFDVDLTGVEEMTGELRQQIVTLVRSQYDARENEQAAKEIERSKAQTVGAGGGDSSTGVDGGTGEAEADIVSGAEAGLEAVVQSQITSITRQRERIRHALVKAEKDVVKYTDLLEQAEFDLDMAMAMKEQYECMRNSPRGSRKTSSRGKGSTAKRSRSSTSKTRSPASRQKTPSKS